LCKAIVIKKGKDRDLWANFIALGPPLRHKVPIFKPGHKNMAKNGKKWQNTRELTGEE
jgi:hypothetical protein